MNTGGKLNQWCCNRGVLIDGQYSPTGTLREYTTNFKSYMESIGSRVEYYEDVRGPSFSLNDYSLIVLCLPTDDIADGFPDEQWGNLASWTSPLKRIFLGLDWRGEGAWEYSVSDWWNPLGLGFEVQEVPEGVSTVAAGTYATVGGHLLNASVSSVEISYSDDFDISGGANPVATDGGTKTFLAQKKTSGIDYVGCGTPSILNLAGAGNADNRRFFYNLLEVSY